MSNTVNKYSYTTYRSMIDKLLEQNKTTGENHSEDMIDYTKMNVHRMNKWDKTVKLNNELLSKLSVINKKFKMVTFTEAWCGDAAHILPIIEKLNQASDNFSHEILLRDQNEELFSKHLYNGTKSIPRVVFFDAETDEEIANWGPRPEPAQTMLTENKISKTLPPEDLKRNMQLWYAKDKSKTIQNELSELIGKLDNITNY